MGIRGLDHVEFGDHVDDHDVSSILIAGHHYYDQ